MSGNYTDMLIELRLIFIEAQNENEVQQFTSILTKCCCIFQKKKLRVALKAILNYNSFLSANIKFNKLLESRIATYSPKNINFRLIFQINIPENFPLKIVSMLFILNFTENYNNLIN